MRLRRYPRIALSVGVLAAVGVSGCGSSGSSHTASAGARSGATPVASSSTYGGVSTPARSASATPAASAAPAALIATKHSKLGTVLAYGPKRLTVYLFEADTGPTSTCAGACAHVWPPVLGRPKAGHGALAADLGTTRRPDGTTQVTYKGHPLYRFIRDSDDGDAYGQGSKSFGAPWYALRASGEKADTT